MSAVLQTSQQDPLFKGAQPALMFAMRFSGDQYQKSAMNGMASPTKSGGKGLAGNDGAAQAGMIQSLVRKGVSSELHYAVLIAQCAPHKTECTCRGPCCSGFRKNWFWEEAITTIVSATAGEFPGVLTKRGLIEVMVKRFFKEPDSRTDAALAKFYEVNRDTIPAYRARIELWMHGEKETKKVKVPKKGVLIRAWEEADAILQHAGII